MFLLLYLAKLEVERVTENIVMIFVLDIMAIIDGIIIQICMIVRLIIGCHCQNFTRMVRKNETD